MAAETRANPLRDVWSWVARLVVPAFAVPVMALLAWEWWPEAPGLSLLAAVSAWVFGRQTLDGWRNR